MNPLEFPILAGIVGSVLHVVSGPDHLVAVAPFAIENKRKAWKIGLMWGVGHLAGMLLIGVLVMLFKDLIPYEAISEHSEKSVGIILILLGLWILFKIFRASKKHEHPHIHTNTEQPKIHDHHHHDHDHAHAHLHDNGKQGLLTTFFVGMVHGLAGVAHFIMFLPVIGFTSTLDAGKYILGFAIGTLFAMTSFAFLMGRFAVLTKADTDAGVFRTLRIVSAIAAIGVGLYWFFAN
ncbi:MAG: sulfite exporter TauE/SafE family protein [Cloacibacterium sp.]|nr:sulfite exporter TauE/SafE family protein [Cloacibacterium sp.]